MNVKSAGKLIKQAASDFSDDNVLTMGAALSYYAMFSIGPLLAIVVALAGAAFGTDTVRHHIHDALQGTLGENSAKIIDSMMATPQHVTSTAMKLIGLGSLLFGSTSFFSQLQTSLSTLIWGVTSKPGRGMLTFVPQPHPLLWHGSLHRISPPLAVPRPLNRPGRIHRLPRHCPQRRRTHIANSVDISVSSSPSSPHFYSR